jgi:hypothetical protein
MRAFQKHIQNPQENPYLSLVDSAIRTMAIVDALIVSGQTKAEKTVVYP